METIFTKLMKELIMDIDTKFKIEQLALVIKEDVIWGLYGK